MNNKKGFTLIELLAVIVLLIVIATIAFPNITRIIKGSKEDISNSQQKVIERAMDAYIAANSDTLTDGDTVCVTDLKKAGLLEYGDISDSSTGQILNGCYKIVWENNQFTYEYNNKTYQNIFHVGDYVKMTPTSTEFRTDPDMTGHSTSQTLNPSELNIWRIIRINSDGTIDMVSDNVSSQKINFAGTIGYKNYIGYLNLIAAQYTNPKYVVRTRYMGYNGQTEYIQDTSAFDGTSNSMPWTCSTGQSCNPDEALGGGDQLYTTDEALVFAVYQTLQSDNDYWLASRGYSYGSSKSNFVVRFVNASGVIGNNYWRSISSSGSWETNKGVTHIRPIVTLKANITPSSGGGKFDGSTPEKAWRLPD